MKQNPNSKYAQISTWAMILNNQVDDITRKRAISEIEKLGGKFIISPEGVGRIMFPPQD